MTPRLAFVFATPMEAAPFLERLSHEAVNDALFLAGSYAVAISGMGLHAAHASVTSLLNRWPLERVVNLGVAGGLVDRYPPGHIVQVASTRGIDAGSHATQVAVLPGTPGYGAGARLHSQNTPVFDATLKAALAEHAELIDMEGHAIAAACVDAGISWLMFKSVSDDATDRAMLIKNLDCASTRLANFIVRHLHHLQPEAH